MCIRDRARIIAGRTKANFINFSAVTSGIKEIKEVMNEAEKNRLMGEKTILFVDEIHRFNKAQQEDVYKRQILSRAVWPFGQPDFCLGITV